MHVHKEKAHPEDDMAFQEMFRFRVEMTHTSSFNRQLSEAVLMKNSKSIILNLKGEYSRCLIPDIHLNDRKPKGVC